MDEHPATSATLHSVTVHSPDRVTVPEVLGLSEFRAVLVSVGLSVLGDQVARIAVALLVFDRTGSEFAASATYACSYLTWLVSGPLLSVLADRYPRRQLMVVCDLLRAGLIAVLLVPEPPLWTVFTVLVLVGLLAPPFDSAKSALLPDLLEGDRYVVGNAVTGAVVQAGHVGGFLLGGVVVAATSVRGALALDMVTFLISAALLCLYVRDRPVGQTTSRSVLRDVREGVQVVADDPVLRRSLGYGVLASVTLVAPEGLAVPVAHALGGGAVTAGVLTASVPAGFVAGSFVILRITPARRLRLLPALAVLACVPLLLSAGVDSVPLLAALWFVSGAGGALSLIANATYMTAVPAAVRGRAFGVAATTLMVAQGVVLLGEGALAEVVPPTAAVAAVAAVALLALPSLAERKGRHRETTTRTGRA